MAQRGGEAMLQEAEMSRQATLLGMSYGQSTGANQAYQQSLMNQQYANQSANQMTTNALQNIDWSKFGGGGNQFSPSGLDLSKTGQSYTSGGTTYSTS